MVLPRPELGEGGQEVVVHHRVTFPGLLPSCRTIGELAGELAGELGVFSNIELPLTLSISHRNVEMLLLTFYLQYEI